MTTLDGTFCLAESEPPFIATMWMVIQEAEPLEGATSPWSMRRIVATLYDGILHLKALGRKPAQICEFLIEYSGLSITPSTLATYLSREKTQRKGKQQQHQRQVQPSEPAGDVARQTSTAMAPEPFLPSQLPPLAPAIDVQVPMSLAQPLATVPQASLNMEQGSTVLSQVQTQQEMAAGATSRATSTAISEEIVPDDAEAPCPDTVTALEQSPASADEQWSRPLSPSPPLSPSSSLHAEANASSAKLSGSPAPSALESLPYWKRFERPRGSPSASKKSEEQREKEKRKPAPEPLLNEPEFNHIARLQLPLDDD